ncbi:MAG: hypothetical protein HQL07_06450 [Nitrospirae bacterium]|nr:hypothetical protein [Magnetococcales bacterium]HAT51569.1 hypothetical protein [Alphaproteobacteria bacterium]
MNAERIKNRKARLARLVREVGNAADVARKAQTSRSYLSQIMGSHGRRNMGDLLAQRLEEAFGKHRGWMDLPEIAPGGDTPFQGDQAAEFVMIPRLEIMASLGTGAEAPEEENIKGHLAFKNVWLQKRRLNPRFLTVIDAVGDSMHPTISDGDVLLVDLRQKEPQDNRIFVLRLDNQLYAKRLHTKDNHKLVVQSDNPTFPPFPMALGQTLGIDIIGRVVWAGRDM